MAVIIIDTIAVHSGSPIDSQSTIHAQDKVCTGGSTSSNYEEVSSFDKTIYRVLSRQEEMKTLKYPDRIRNEFDLFLQYGERVDSGEAITSFAPLDEYLGSIGVSNGIC